MITRAGFTCTAIGLTILSVMALAFGSWAMPAARGTAFVLEFSFDGSEVTVNSSEGAFHELRFTLSAGDPGPVFLSEHGVIGQSTSGADDSYCFSVSLLDDKLVLESVRGTSWTELSYSCGDTVPCSFIVTEFGVRGR